MIRDIPRFSKHNYDVLIVGGGINGAAIAYMASLVGARVALVEKNDFASGTSSKSTKLLHGGIRYLENLELDLVAESLKERYIQYQNAPHLVKKLSFVIPVYRNETRPLWMMKLGVWLYDLLSGPYRLGKHNHLSRERLLSVAPLLAQKTLVGAVSYYDAQMDDVRICLENVLMADVKGAHVANYTEVVEFLKENGKCVGVKAKDILTGRSFEVRAKTVVVTAGPWSDLLLRKDSKKSAPRLRATKGVHILYKGQLSDQAFLLQSASDRRVFFVIPFRGHSLIGTTDTDYEGNPDQVSVDDADVDYLLKEAARVFPQIAFNKDNIITSFAGLRPLVHEKGSPSKISRKQRIEKSFSGIWYVLGGKYTTYRAIAKECIIKVLPRLSRKLPSDKEHPLFGSGEVSVDIKQAALRFGVPSETVTYLIGLYGSRYWDVLKMIDDDSSLRVRLCECSVAIRAQVAYSVKVEMAQTFDDVYLRRLQLQYNDCPSRQCRHSVENVFKTYVA
ncbi:MAG: glycerol-3-phosphate dehydrogenase/oxidase [Candidatus Omnitrophica bacterium]|nr:glycerol-3-phosphate dehydrogenase/oxidase [Candidatus Omnitrophota bacterium]